MEKVLADRSPPMDDIHLMGVEHVVAVGYWQLISIRGITNRLQ